VLLLFPHRGHALEARGRDQQGRLGVSHPERAQELQVLGEVEAEGPAGDDGIHALDRNQVAGRERRGGVRGQCGAERLDRVRVQFHPRRHPVTPEAREVFRAGREPRMQVVGRDAPTGPAAGAAGGRRGTAGSGRGGGGVEGDHHAGPAPALHQAGGHYSDHSGMPALACYDDRRLVGLRRGGCVGGEEDLRLRLLAVAVQEIELAGHLAGAGGVVGEKQLEGRVGSLHSACRVDPRPEAEPE
jgi:hypothetical protein